MSISACQNLFIQTEVVLNRALSLKTVLAEIVKRLDLNLYK